jgi:hypothetical protein
MAYGIFAGLSWHGILTCLICAEDTLCFRLKFGGKICYFNCHRCFLPQDHGFRFDRNAFRKDTIVMRGSPKRLSGPEILARLNNLKLNDMEIVLEVLEPSIIGLTNVVYGNSLM